jgi:membrane protease YdiL (CAAX protease family)
MVDRTQPPSAPAEELLYRGFAQRQPRTAGLPILGVVVPAAIFGVQHLFFAPTADAMVVYGLAFFVWGLGSALI